MALLTNFGGEVHIDSLANTTGFDIRYSGKMIASISLPSNWIIISTDKRMVGLSSDGVSFDEGILFNYKGNITITRCTIATHDLQREDIQVENKTYNWDDLTDGWDSSESKPDDNIYIEYVNVSKNTIKHYDLIAKDGEYFYENKQPVSGGTAYHIDVLSGQAYLGGRLSVNSQKIYKMLGNGKLFNVKKIIRPKALKMNIKQLKDTAEKIRGKSL